MSDARRSPAVPTVSVVIPCYNYGSFLEGCLASVMSQEGVSVRALVIDDCSTDDSLARARALADRYDEVEVIHHPVNRGHIATYNEGLMEWADGDYVLLLSADDLLAPGALARAVTVMEDHPSVGLVYGHPLEFSSTGSLPPPVLSARGVSLWSGDEWVAKRFAEAVNVVSTPTAVVRRSTHVQVGGYDPALPHAADLELWLRLGLHADVAYVRGATAAYYRVHQRSMSQHVYQNRLADVLERKRVFDSVLRKHADKIARAGIDRHTADRALVGDQLWGLCRAYEDGNLGRFPVEDVLAFADEVFPGWSTLPAGRAFVRRRRLGPAVCHRTQVFLGTAVVRRIDNELWWRRWKRVGA